MKTVITFELKTPTNVLIKRNGKLIGDIWSEKEEGVMNDITLPFPHENKERVLNSIQMCGFDEISPIWGCGPFHGKKDCVISFIPESEWTDGKIIEYERYVKEMIAKGETGELQNFNDWRSHNI